MSLLETKSLTIGYQSGQNNPKVLQKDINLLLQPGEIVSLMGQNGVGKTTFIKTITRLLPALGGEVRLDSKNLFTISDKDLAKKVSVVLTEKPFSLNISVIELIALGRHPYSNWLGVLSSEDKQKVEWAINETHVNYIANKKLYELSDGQLQKVMIARALAQETDIIILDEPAAHLDLYNKIEVMLLLRAIAKTGKGILISTHDMQVSTQLSDKLWLFNFNEPVLEGNPEDLILSGQLEKTLYLQDYGYDMIHGSVRLSQNIIAEIELQGEKEMVFWTEQALSRNDFKSVSESDIKISCKQSLWVLKTHEMEKECASIAQLLVELKKISNKNQSRND